MSPQTTATSTAEISGKERAERSLTFSLLVSISEKDEAADWSSSAFFANSNVSCETVKGDT